MTHPVTSNQQSAGPGASVTGEDSVRLTAESSRPQGLLNKGQRCGHPNLPPVEFDAEAAKGLDNYEVRRRWPRLYCRCADCGSMVMKYASQEHYYAGDW